MSNTLFTETVYGSRCGVGFVRMTGAADFAYALTPCCGASATGVSVTAANPTGVACRGCYKPTPAVFAGDMSRYANALVAVTYAGCPDAENCATEVLHHLGY